MKPSGYHKKLYFRGMVLKLLFAVLFMGFVTSVLLGPVGILIIQRTVNRSQLSGLFSGLGAAVSDTIYATIAGFSVAIIIHFVKENELLFKTGGALIFLLLGVMVLFSRPGKKNPGNSSAKGGHFRNFISTFFLAFTNPLIIFVHLALFATLGIALDAGNPWSALLVIISFLAGAFLWWFALTGIISRFREKFSSRICLWFNRISGSAIILLVLVSLVISFLQHTPLF